MTSHNVSSVTLHQVSKSLPLGRPGQPGSQSSASPGGGQDGLTQICKPQFFRVLSILDKNGVKIARDKAFRTYFVTESTLTFSGWRRPVHNRTSVKQVSQTTVFLELLLVLTLFCMRNDK